jgi:hypothetical protein
MPYQATEQFVAGKLGDPDKCEDFLFVSPHYAAVIDGSSIKSRTFGHKSSGRFIAEVIDDALATLVPGLDMPTATRAINAAIRNQLGYSDNDAVMSLGARPAASAAILSMDRREIWAYGDTLLVLDGRVVDLTKKIDTVTTQYRCAYVLAERLSGRSVDALMRESQDLELIQPLLQRQQARFLNNVAAGDLAYANFDGSDQVIPLVRVIDVAGVETILMGSDGYPCLLSTLAETEAELARILAVDPLMYGPGGFPQVKGIRLAADAPPDTPWPGAYDDRCYLKLERQ